MRRGALLLFLAVAAIAQELGSATAGMGVAEGCRTYHCVIKSPPQKYPRITWNHSDPDFNVKLTHVGVPTLIKGAFEHWPARKTWSPEWFTDKLGDRPMTQVWRHDKRVFWHTDKSRDILTKWDEVDIINPFHIVQQMSTREFFANASAPREQVPFYFYFSDGTRWLEEFSNDVEPADMFKFDDPNASLWINSAGMVAPLHFDANTNFFAQLHGKKRFTMINPRHVDDLYLFPCLHPAYRQSQVDFDNVDIELFPRFANLTYFEEDLEPGDMIFLPPYWFHRVEAVTLAISISQHSYSRIMLPDQERTQAAFAAPIPFQEEWSNAQLLLGLRLYLELTADAVYHPGYYQTYIRHIHAARFGKIFRGVTYSQERIDALCPRVVPDAQADQANLRFTESDVAQMRAAMQTRANELAAIFHAIQQPGIQDIYYGNYVENLVKFTARMNNVDIFIKHCGPIPMTVSASTA